MEAHDHFMRLSEAYIPTAEAVIGEADDDEAAAQDPNAMGGDPNAMGGDPNMMGGDPNAMGGGQDPNMMGGGDPNAMGGGDPNMMGGDPNAMGGEDPNAMGGDPMAQDPMGADQGMMGDEGMDMPEEDENDTIDIDSLTKAQQKSYKKTNQLGKEVIKTNDKMAELSSMIDDLMAKIESNNKKIEDLNKEFQVRVQTPTEKLNLRSLRDSYPFNVNPTQYWEKVAKDLPQYSVTDDNEPNSNKEYTITQQDIDDANDKEIEDSFIDDQMRQDINKIFGI
jgi:hypothetical protein